MQAPSAPDPYQTAQAQAGMNRETAITQFGLNAHNQVNPWGTTSWDQSGTWADGTPRYTQTTNLSPGQQETFDLAQKAQTNVAGLAVDQTAAMRDRLAKPFEFTNRDAENWAWDLASPRILNQQASQEEQLRSTLAAKGIREGSAAWNSEMERLGRSNTDQMNQLALGGRQMAYGEARDQYTLPINTMTALMSGSQVMNPAQMSSAGPQTQVGGVDYTGLVSDKFKADTAQNNAMMGGLFGLASAPFSMFKFSDARLKENARRIGRTDGGVPIYVYNYKGDPTPQMGVMAQDVPEASTVDPASGYLMVDYSRVR